MVIVGCQAPRNSRWALGAPLVGVLLAQETTIAAVTVGTYEAMMAPILGRVAALARG